MNKSTNECSYVIKDDDGNYVGDIAERTNYYVYSYSDRFKNGIFSAPIEMAQIQLDKCKNIAKRIKFDKEFHIEEINIIKTIHKESKLPEDLYPIKYRYIEKELEIA